MENYIVINGKKAELTPEQLKALGLKTEIKSPFERVKEGKEYCYIDNNGKLTVTLDTYWKSDETRHEVANYCTDREIMEQRALHETLNRLLWRYSMEHGGREIDWSNGSENKYYVYYNSKLGKWYANYITFCYEVCTPHFHTKEIAENAIKEIIEPFMEQHPDFKF
jgi:hypothetical protein